MVQSREGLRFVRIELRKAPLALKERLATVGVFPCHHTRTVGRQSSHEAEGGYGVRAGTSVGLSDSRIVWKGAVTRLDKDV